VLWLHVDVGHHSQQVVVLHFGFKLHNVLHHFFVLATEDHLGVVLIEDI
jgi:hypothetical protein